ncbi:Gag-pro-like protein [Gossypium australe]|uniref:Gag-pro-like protein n=1 Tax=Gossypium australe TaxID=47621 RepID=A0A5B6VYP5_9ROSI|nr:Gag-pro-like protein [Gossypium australe]
MVLQYHHLATNHQGLIHAPPFVAHAPLLAASWYKHGKETYESLRQYSQRWRDTTPQMQPLLTQRETTMSFVSTLQPSYHDKIDGSATRNFNDSNIRREMIENTIKG